MAFIKITDGETMNKTLITLVTVGLVTTSAFAVDTTACAGCHGANFEKAALGKSKIVKDMTAADIVTALKGYKDDSYGGPMKSVMKGQVAKLSDADIDAIAAQIAGGEAPKAADAAKTEGNATVTDKVVDAVKEKATEAVSTAVDVAKAKATEVATDAAAKLVK